MDPPAPESDAKDVVSRDGKPKSDVQEGRESPNGKGNLEGLMMGSETLTPAEQPGGQTVLPGTRKSVTWRPDLVTESPSVPSPDYASNPYVSPSPASTSLSLKETVDTVRNVLGRWGKKVGEATKKAEDLAGNTWQHLKTSPSFTDAALGRIAQGTKVLAEGGYERIFTQTFETVQEEQLQNSYACYLSTSAGPVLGILYVSTAKLAFCSDNPLSYKSEGQTEWSYYKVVIPRNQLKAVNPSSSKANRAEKYIQVVSVDNLEFWFMGFFNYDGAVECLQEALRTQAVLHSVEASSSEA